MARLGARARPEPSSRWRAVAGIGVRRATGRPRSVIVTVSPAAAVATTAEAFCFNARIPTSDMCFIVVRRGSLDGVSTRARVDVPEWWRRYRESVGVGFITVDETDTGEQAAGARPIEQRG